MGPSASGRRLRVLAIMFVIALAAAACGKSSSSGGGTTSGGAQKKGGSIVLAAEQWPQCLNPITSCAQASWLPWTAWEYVMPRLMEVDAKGNYVASDLLTEAPTTQNGDIKTNPFTVTFKLRPEAVWDDGTPITSADISFTEDAVMKSKGTLSTTGYDQISSIDTADPHTAVIHFKAPYADWWDLFGGNNANGVILKKAAFSSPDVSKDMLTSYTFSGGPFKLKSWSKQQSVLVRNDKYWIKSKIPLLDQVTFVPREDQTTELNSLATGEALGAYPQPSIGITKRVTQPGLKFSSGAGTTYEGLWMNESKAPFNDEKVREAFAYAVDRQAVIGAIYKSDFPTMQPLNCGNWVPNVGTWCQGIDNLWGDISYQPDKAKSLLQSAGWTLGSDGIFAKGGQRLSIQFSTTAGNHNREATQALLKDKAKAAGIELVIKNFEPTQLFEDKLPHLDYQLAEFAEVAPPDPSVTSLMSCDQIPSKANSFSGQNDWAWCDKTATKLLKQSDATIDITQRQKLIAQIAQMERQQMVFLPMFQKPLMLVWHDDRLTGPIGAYAASSYGGFFNMYAWSLK